jgi:hypothetical protein
MQSTLEMIADILKTIAAKFGLVPNEMMKELSGLMRLAFRERERWTLEQVAEQLRPLTADNGPVRYERCLGSLDEMLRGVEAELQQLCDGPPELTELERLVLHVVQEDGDVKATANEVTMKVNRRSTFGVAEVRDALDTLAGRGLLSSESYTHTRVYFPVQDPAGV